MSFIQFLDLALCSEEWLGTGDRSGRNASLACALKALGSIWALQKQKLNLTKQRIRTTNLKRDDLLLHSFKIKVFFFLSELYYNLTVSIERFSRVMHIFPFCAVAEKHLLLLGFGCSSQFHEKRFSHLRQK